MMDHNMIMNSESLAPFVINLPYGQYSREAFEKAFDESLEKQMGRSVNDSDLEHFMLRYVLAYPTVYVLQQYVLQHIKTVLIEESNQSTRIRKNCSQFLQSNRRIDSLDFPIESKSAGLDDFVFHDLMLFRET